QLRHCDEGEDAIGPHEPSVGSGHPEIVRHDVERTAEVGRHPVEESAQTLDVPGMGQGPVLKQAALPRSEVLEEDTENGRSREPAEQHGSAAAPARGRESAGRTVLCCTLGGRRPDVARDSRAHAGLHTNAACTESGHLFSSSGYRTTSTEPKTVPSRAAWASTWGYR